MNPADFVDFLFLDGLPLTWYRHSCSSQGDPLTFHIAPPSGNFFYLPDILVYEQIPAKLMTFLTVSAVLCV